MLKKNGSQDPASIHTFENHWPSIQPTVVSLLTNNYVTEEEWQDLFHKIHMVCSWDLSGCAKLFSALEEEVRKVPMMRMKTDLVKADVNLEKYSEHFVEFRKLYRRMSLAFQQLDLAIRKFAIQAKTWADNVSIVESMMLRIWDKEILKPLQVSGNRNFEPESIAGFCDSLLKRTNRKLPVEKISLYLEDASLVSTFVADLGLKTEEQFKNALAEVPDMPYEDIYKISRMLEDMKSSNFLQNDHKRSDNKINNNNNNTLDLDISCQLMENLSLFNNNESIGSKNNKSVINNNEPEYHHVNKSSLRNGCNLTHIKHHSMSIKVLNPSAWPKPNDTSIVPLPRDIMSEMSRFDAYFVGVFPGRNLDWSYQLSNGTITMNTDQGQFDLDVNAYQLAVISSFEGHPRRKMSFEELMKASGLTASELKRALWSLLSNPRFENQIMDCEPNINTVNDLNTKSNRYGINQNFAIICRNNA